MNATTAPAKKAQLLGTTDECDTCDLCGRDDLKRTVVIRLLDSGETIYAGSDCASRTLGWTQATVRSRAKAADRDAHRKAMQEYTRECDRIRSEWEERYRTWLRATHGSDDDSLSGPLVSRPRERGALRDQYKAATGDHPVYPERPARPTR